MLRAVPWLLSGWRELQRSRYLLSLWHSQPGLSVEMLAWPLEASGGHNRTGRRVAFAAMLWASYSQQGHCEGISPGTHCSLSSSSTCSSRKERPGLGSLLPSCGRLSVGMYLRCPGNSDTFGKEMFSLNVYTGAAWRR